MIDECLLEKDRKCLILRDKIDVGCCIRRSENMLNRQPTRLGNSKLSARPRATTVGITCSSLLKELARSYRLEGF